MIFRLLFALGFIMISPFSFLYMQPIPENGQLNSLFFDIPESDQPIESEDYLRYFLDHPIDIRSNNPNIISLIPSISQLEALSLSIINLDTAKNGKSSIRNIFEADTSLFKKYTLFITSSAPDAVNSSLLPNGFIPLDRFKLKIDIRHVSNFYVDTSNTIDNLVSVKLRGENSGNTNFGFVMNKFSNHSTREYFSFFITFNNIGSFEKIIIGDFRISFGNNLLYGKYFQNNMQTNIFSHANSAGILESNINLSSSLSTRGFSAIYNLTPYTALIPFAAKRTLQSARDSSGINTISPYQLKSPYADLFTERTGSIDEVNAGIIINHYFNRNFSFSGLLNYKSYNEPVRLNREDSKYFLEYSVSGLLQFEKFSVTGEIAQSEKTVPYRLNIFYLPAKGVFITYGLRNFPSYSNQPYSKRQGVSAYNDFEAGNSFALKTSINSFTFYSYFDQFTYSDIAANISFLTGNALSFKLEKDFSDRYKAKFLLRQITKQVPKNNSTGHIILSKESKIGNAELLMKISKNISSKMTILYRDESLENFSRSKGLGGQFDCSIRIRQNIQMKLSFTGFHTDDYSGALGFYEPELPGSSSYTPLYYDGTRNSLTFLYEPAGNLHIGCKLASITQTRTISKNKYSLELKASYEY